MSEPKELPKRDAAELADALRVRAGFLSGERWEVPATVAMMCEAADALEQGAALRSALTDLVQHWREYATTQGAIYGSGLLDAADRLSELLGSIRHEG